MFIAFTPCLASRELYKPLQFVGSRPKCPSRRARACRAAYCKGERLKGLAGSPSDTHRLYMETMFNREQEEVKPYACH